MSERRAKIVATLGPASSSDEVLAALLEAGVDVVRLNLSHGSHDDHRALIEAVRRLAGERERFVPIVLDLMGPRYRLGELAGGARSLEDGEEVRLVDAAVGDQGALPLGNPELLDHIRPGERVLIDNGLVELAVASCPEGAVHARVVHGGKVASRKGINLPDTNLPFQISPKDRADIAFAAAEGVDYLAASYVNRAEDLDALAAVAEEAGRRLPLIAKLERQGSIERLEELVERADAVMVARGDLGVEVPLHRVPVLQKEIIAAGRRRGKPVIVATEMLESMMERPRPTRAEASDVANAVFDGADALMLSGETAAGKHPVAAVEVMDRIVRQAETYDQESGRGGRTAPPGIGWHSPSSPSTEGPGIGWHRVEGRVGEAEPTLPSGGPRGGEPTTFEGKVLGDGELETIAEVVSSAAVYAAERLPVERIVAFSQGGFTARMIARSRPRAPILVFTTDPVIARRCQLVWGVRPLLMKVEADHHDQVVELVERQLLAAGLAQPGESIVILMGDPIRERALTNLMRVHRIAGG